MSAKRFKVLGINDDEDSCECCGKENLKKVVWIEDTETGSIQHFGVICAMNPKKAFGLKSEINKAESFWQSKQAMMWRRAWSIYRSKGGKCESNGIPLHQKGGGVVASNKELWEKCIQEAKESSLV